MASIFSHAIVASGIGRALPKNVRNWKLIFFGVFCACIPDADVLSFTFGIPYESMFGHRGFFHSFFFNMLLALLIVFSWYKTDPKKILIAAYLFICGATHGLLDAMTTGGTGIAFFSPFDETRYFLPWRVIQVSPIGVGKFFSEWGVRVIKSELYWIILPTVLFVLMKIAAEKISNRQQKV